MRALLLHNPKAGRADHTKADLVAALAATGLDISYCSTRDDAFPDCLAKDFDAVIVAGGDGTVAKVVKQLPDRRRPVGIVPLGGANNVATSLGIPRGALVTAGGPGAAVVRDLHVGHVRGPSGKTSFLEGVGFGPLAASIAAEEPPAASVGEKIANGRRSFAAALARLEAAEADLTIDGEALAGRWLMVEVLTFSHSGPRLPLAPRSKGLEGALSVVLLEEDRRSAMLDWLNDPEGSDPPVRVAVGRRISFRLDRDRPFRIDDDTAGATGHQIEIGIDAEPLRVLVPERRHGDG